MHFAKLSAVLLGLAAFTSAFPNAVERRMAWTPRSLERRNDGGGKGKGKDSITIVDTTVVKLTEESRNSEVELTILVQEKITTEDQKKTAKDNVRKNHYRNKNKDVNTIIIVVTVILDIRDSKNPNKRYMKHQLRADNNAREDIIIQVTEVVAITISNDNSNNRGSNRGSNNKGSSQTKGGNAIAATAASGAAANAIQTVDPNAPFSATNQTMLMPSGASAPGGQNVELDPAAIVEEVTVGFVVQQVRS